ncbi:hypothetical protein ACFQMM_22435 [Saliphagus sp. GCM10025308]
MTLTYPTYPVRQDVEFTVTVAIGGDSDEQLVEVAGIDDLDSELQRPAPTLTVQPGTTVMFEVPERLDDDHDVVETNWFLNDVHQYAPDGPWTAAYTDELETSYWLHVFDAEGTYDVLGAVATTGSNYRANWEVTVDTTGDAPPTATQRRPDTGMVATTPDRTHAFELDVESRDAALDRVVWWVHQWDRLVGVSEIDGHEDAAAVEIDGGCHTCDVYAWIFDRNNAMVEVQPWTFYEFTIELDESIESLESFGESLETRGMTVTYLQLVENRLYLDYQTRNPAGWQKLDELTTVAGAYASLIAAGYPAELAHVIFLDEENRDLGGYIIDAEWASAFAAGGSRQKSMPS